MQLGADSVNEGVDRSSQEKVFSLNISKAREAEVDIQVWCGLSPSASHIEDSVMTLIPSKFLQKIRMGPSVNTPLKWESKSLTSHFIGFLRF